MGDVVNVKRDSEGNLNSGHLYELTDRLHIICNMLDDYVIDHPGSTPGFNEKCFNAQKNLIEAQEIADKISESMFDYPRGTQ